MTYTTLITTGELANHLDDPNWAIVDCRFLLPQPERGRQDYLHSHIPGAVYAHLDHDLSAPIIPGETGRHPWPSIDKAVGVLSGMGIGPGVQVIAYDDAGGALAAARLWWTLRWLGHDAVAVLDGGWKTWLDGGHLVRTGEEVRLKREFTPQVRPSMNINANQVEELRQEPACRIIDVRAPERYRGEFEPIDVMAGHIPGAFNAPFLENLDEQGKFRSREELRSVYQELLGEIPPQKAVFYCGSGVTSIHSLLALMVAGLGEARLYAGSWSEWITDPSRPIATMER